MFTLKFRKSRSAKYKEVERILSYMDDYEFKDDLNIVTMSVREIYQKWDFFNHLFWTTIDWKGTTFGFDTMHYHSHSDKTRLFYAIQHAHSSWICMNVNILSYLNLIYSGEMTLDAVRDLCAKEYNMNTDTDEFLELYQTLKGQYDYEKEFKSGPFVIPKVCSYDNSLRLENKIIKLIQKRNSLGDKHE